MVTLILVVAVSLAAGFGAGRVHNANKIAAIKAELTKVETSAVTEVKSLVSAIRAKL